MQIVDRNIEIGTSPQIFGDQIEACKIDLVKDQEGIKDYRFTANDIHANRPVLLKWKFPALNVKGVWTSNALMEKRIRADWELPHLSSRVSVDAPIICAFGHNDQNLYSVVCSDVINTIDFELSYREEDDFMYCTLTFFRGDHIEVKNYECTIRVDERAIQFSSAIQEASLWLDGQLAIRPVLPVEAAKMPLYSTWYSFHQNFKEEQLLAECEASSKLGYKVLVVDDGWQTLDGNRGYDYTGDWAAERIANVPDFVQKVKAYGMKTMFWYSVPFCGKKSKAYQEYKGKFLTEGHPWAPVFDPRFPEVRAYLISKYVQATKEWKLDGLKLDFIDDFRIYADTETENLDGRDTLSVNYGVKLLIDEIRMALHAINPDVLIEFRQKYISPYLRTIGNMFRAFDCPGDTVMNRVRTTDVKLLCGSTAVHSDMITWNINQKVEIAAFQFTSILFSVPQLSVRIDELPESHYNCVNFFTQYWLKNRKILLDGAFTAHKPMSNYPILQSSNEEKTIYGLYEDIYLDLDLSRDKIDIINGKLSEEVVVNLGSSAENWNVKVFNCEGVNTIDYDMNDMKGLYKFEANPNGIIQLKKKR